MTTDTIIHTLEVEDLTPAAFAPFGEVLAVRERPTFDLPTKTLHRFDWSTDSEIIVQIIAFKPLPLIVGAVERHWHVTESRMHIGGSPAVVVVAPPSDAPPTLSDLRAFRIDRQGFMFKTGTWHSLNAYPEGSAPSEFLFLSDRATQSELFDNPTPNPVRSSIHRFETGIAIRPPA